MHDRDLRAHGFALAGGGAGAKTLQPATDNVAPTIAASTCVKTDVPHEPRIPGVRDGNAGLFCPASGDVRL